MPWYRIHVMHGGGHQGTTVWYEYATERIEKEEVEYYLECKCESRGLRNWIAKMTMVKKIPYEIKEEEIQRYKRRIQSAKEMLKILKDTEVRKHKRPEMSRATYLARMKLQKERTEFYKKKRKEEAQHV